MKRKTLQIVCLLLALLVAMFATGYTFAWFSNYEYKTFSFGASTKGAYFDGGDGTEENPYGISSKQHLYNLAWLQNTDKFGSTKYYFQLKNSIDMTGVILPPIGNDESPFLGVFDGNGYTITNLTISTNKKVLTNLPQAASNYVFSNCVGMFGMTGEGSDVTNFILKNPTVEVADCKDYNAVAGTDGEPSASSSPKAVGLAIGYISSSASSIGVYGGKLSVRVGNYETLNSILGKAASNLSIDLTGGTGDSGIFSPNSGTKLATALSTNANQYAPDGTTSTGNSNGLWVVSAEDNSTLGAFTVTSKPTVNGSITNVGSASVTTSSISGVDASKIVDVNGDKITKITGYLAFSGVADCYSYDNIIDENGTDMSSKYKIGAHTVKSNSIKFNINNNGASVYVLAASNSNLSGSNHRDLALYKTTDSSGNSIDYSNPDDFYELYSCTNGHTKYTYDWTTESGSTTIAHETELYHNKEKATCGYRQTCSGTIAYDAETDTYRCTNYAECGYTVTGTVAHTDTCVTHNSTKTYTLIQDDTNGTQLKSVLMCNGGNTVYATNFSGYNGIEYYTRGNTSTSSKNTYTAVDYSGSTVSGGSTYTPLTLKSSGTYKFKANYSGKITFHFKSTSQPTFTANGTAITLTTTSSNGWNSSTTVSDYTASMYVTAGSTYTMTYTANSSSNNGWNPGGSSSSSTTVDLTYIEFVSCDTTSSSYPTTKYRTITTCEKSTEEHADSDFGVVQDSSYSHIWNCKRAVSLVSEKARYSEINYAEQGRIEMNSMTPVYYVFSGLSKGSYQLSSAGSGIRIYYLRVDGMTNGNTSFSNVSNIDFIYDGVTIQSVDGGYQFTVNDEKYTETMTRINFTVTSFNSSILLYFHRDDTGSVFSVGYNPSAPSGKATFISVSDDLVIDTDYTPTEWKPN